MTPPFSSGDTSMKSYFHITKSGKMYTIEALKDGSDLTESPGGTPGIPDYIAAEGSPEMLKRHSPPTDPVPIELVIAWIDGYRRFRCTTEEMIEGQ